ncbi:MAG: hypothetical protein ACRDI2_08335 [Chloroflexota bacterium]
MNDGEAGTAFERAQTLEASGDSAGALAVYLDILRQGGPADAMSHALCYERPAAILEAQGRYDEALALCERALHTLDRDGSAPAEARAEAQLSQRRLRLLRKLGRPVWSSQMGQTAGSGQPHA